MSTNKKKKIFHFLNIHWKWWSKYFRTEKNNFTNISFNLGTLLFKYQNEEKNNKEKTLKNWTRVLYKTTWNYEKTNIKLYFEPKRKCQPFSKLKSKEPSQMKDPWRSKRTYNQNSKCQIKMRHRLCCFEKLSSINFRNAILWKFFLFILKFIWKGEFCYFYPLTKKKKIAYFESKMNQVWLANEPSNEMKVQENDSSKTLQKLFFFENGVQLLTIKQLHLEVKFWPTTI